MAEKLTTQHDGKHWHVRYPTALRTLCGELAVPNGVGRNWPPTCSVCLTAAALFDRIDHSAPEFWRHPLGWSCAAVTRKGSRCRRVAGETGYCPSHQPAPENEQRLAA